MCFLKIQSCFSGDLHVMHILVFEVSSNLWPKSCLLSAQYTVVWAEGYHPNSNPAGAKKVTRQFQHFLRDRCSTGHGFDNSSHPFDSYSVGHSYFWIVSETERLKRLVTFQTFDHSDEATWPDHDQYDQNSNPRVHCWWIPFTNCCDGVGVKFWRNVFIFISK